MTKEYYFLYSFYPYLNKYLSDTFRYEAVQLVFKIVITTCSIPTHLCNRVVKYNRQLLIRPSRGFAIFRRAST